MEQNGNANACFSFIAAQISVSVNLKQMTVGDRRAIFNALLMDAECNPGQTSLSITERQEAVSHFQRWGGWPQR